MEEEFSHDDYQSLLIKTLGERLAEAAAEKIHETLRKEVWGYAKDEKLTMKQLLNEDYQGIRPARGVSFSARHIGQLSARQAY